MLAAIIPPSNLTWSAKAAIEPSRKAFSDLTAEQRRFFAPLPGDAIVFGGAIEVTPEVSLEKPDINLSVSLRTLLRGGRTMPRGRPLGRDNNPDESPLNPLPIDHVWQTLEVKTEGTAGEIRSMRLRFAADHDEAGATQSSEPPPWSEMQWAVQLQTDAPEFAVDDDLISRQFIEGVRSWEVRVALPPRFTNQSLLIGRRRQEIDPKRSNLTIGLPHVPDAASQSAEVWIDPTLQLKQHFDSLKGVPTLDSTKVGRNEPALSTRVRWSRRATSTSETARYRYEPNDRPWIEVMPRQHHSPTGLIVGKRLTAVASVNGTDLFQLDCLVRSNAEMELTFPMSLQLVEVRRDGVLITPRLVPGRGVILPPPAPRTRSKSITDGDGSRGAAKGTLASQSVSAPRWSRLQVNWISPATRGGWYRWFQFPEIHLDQLVVDARRELLAATGTNVVQFSAAPWGAASMSAPLLLPAGFLSSLGWVIAFLLLGLARLVGSRGLPTIAASIVLALSASLLWPSSSMPLVAFVALPLTLAALQLATTGWNRYREESDSSSEWANRSGSMQASAGQFSSPDFSSSRLSLGDETTARRADAGALHRTTPVQPSANDSWTRKFEAGEIISSEVHSDGIVHEDGSSQQNERSRDGTDDDFSSSSIVPLLIACVCTLSALFVGGNASAQVLPSPPVASGSLSAKDAAPPTIDVLVPLKSNGDVLGNKIYIPEAFYNELFFRDLRSEIQTPMIESVAYEVKLASPLQGNGAARLDPISRSAFPSIRNSSTDRTLEAGGIGAGNVTAGSRGGGRAGLTAETLRQSGAARLTARLGVVLPPETRRLRLPYRFEQVLGVARVQSGVERQTLRWGDDGDGWVWVEMPSSERDLTVLRSAELLLSLQCDYEWEDPWVLVSAKLPPLSVAQLNVAASDSVDSVMLQNSTSSWIVDLQRKLGVDPVIPTASALAEPDTQYSEPVHLGPVNRLQLRYQFRDVATEAASSSDAMLPWDDERYWQKRFWVHSQSGKTVIECEIQPRRSLPPEAIVMLSTNAPEVHGVESFDESDVPNEEETFDESPTCKLLTQHWSRQPIEENAGDRSLRLMSLTTPTRPIRLGWTLTTPREGVWRIRMPRVSIGVGAFVTQGPRAVPVITPEELGGFGEDLDEPEITPALLRTADESLPWVAWTFSDDLQPDWSQIGGLEPLAVDQFYAKWTGYLSSINRAAVGTVTDLTLKRIAKPKTPLVTKHEVTIEKDSQRVEFFAEIRGPSPGRVSSSASVGSTRYAVHLPPNARLLDWNYEPIGDDSGNGFGGKGNPNSETGSGEFANASGSDASGNVEATNSSEASTLPDGDSKRQPWTVSQQGNVTTLLLTSDREGFRLSVNAMLPISPGKRVNRLPLMRLEKITKASLHDGGGASNVPDFDESHELLITRAVDVVVDWARPVGGQKIDAGVDDAASLLTAGRVVESRYTTSGPIEEAFESARFRVRRNNRPFDVDSRITLRWDEGRWTAQTDCVITSKYCPDYIDIALPTRWCDSLQIVPLCISSRQPTLDPALQVLRLELRRDEDGGAQGDTNADSDSGVNSTEQEHVRRFRLISRLAVSEITRVSVPEIRIMDVRRHRIDVVVPTRLTNEQVRWRSNFAGPIAKPRWRIDQLSEDFAATSANATPPAKPNDSDSNMELSVYAVTSPGWSIDLETLPRTDRVAELIHADHRVLVRPQDQRWLMVSRFDILPGDQSSVRLAVPAAAELVGVWAGTRAADLRRIGDNGERSQGNDGRSSDRPNRPGVPAQANQADASTSVEMSDTENAEVVYEVPLPLSRLSQTVEVLVAFPDDLSGLLLPNLLGLSTAEDEASVDWWDAPPENGVAGNVAVPTLEWLRALQREAGLGMGNEETGDDSVKVAPIASRTRLRWLASCVVEAIRSSSDALADRRDEEVAVWLRPWILRYRMLCEAAGRQIGGPSGEESTLVSQDDPRDRELAKALITEPLLGWEEMDAYILSQETRYFSFDAFLEETLPDLDAATEGNLRSSTPATRLGDLALSGRDFATTWSDFLAVTTPPGFVDRYTFVWKGRRLPIQMLADRPVPLSEYARQQVLRGGLFIALAGLVLVVALLPRARSAANPYAGNAAGRLPGVNWEHPSLWLFVLSAIGMVLMPIPMAIGLMVAALVLGGSDWSRRWFLSQGWWGSKKSQRTQNNGATENPMKSNAIHVDAGRSGSGVRSSGTMKSSRG
ncbi:hypothetical protein [Rhodopirellula sallentina]|uniref:Putative membrane protein n=1 Tax=Rhodopirellula sallentina SM41 TaxID=1263870 RepID=M5UAV1_9BACT|nr:hypothetical protein [Rhodopirellula sallentina]EMI58429.1 putative membrane protein [Rhodopirellula sallentina SM41]